MKILVTDGNTLPGLAITRSLGKAGHTVIVGFQGHNSLASMSKYANNNCIYPDPVSQPDAFVNFLLEYIEYYKIDAIFPVTDITTFLITKNKLAFEKHSKIPFAEYSVVQSAANKADIIKVAKELGIDVPYSIIIENYSQLLNTKIDIQYPLVIKPSRSRILTENGWISTAVTYADNEYELKKKISGYSEAIFPIILQERIQGPGMGVFLCFNNQKPVATFSHKRLREKPPSGGVSVLRESVKPDPLAYEFSCKLLEAIKWQGVAMVEFKVDNRDMRPKLMEINGRFWGSLQLAIDAGVNFPMILADMLESKPIAPSNDYELGIKTRWLWGDIDALLIRLIQNEEKQQLPDDADSRMRHLLKFLIFWQPRMHYEVLKISDIKPWLYESFLWLKNMIQKN